MSRQVLCQIQIKNKSEWHYAIKSNANCKDQYNTHMET